MRVALSSSTPSDPVANTTKQVSWRWHLLILAAYTLVTVAMTYPAAFFALDKLPVDADALKHTWRVAWEVRQLIGDPVHLFNANSFYYLPNSFAFDDIMLSQGLTVLPIALATGNIVLAHNLILLSTYVLCAYGMFLLILHVTRHPLAAWVAGLIFAFSTFRVIHYSQMNLMAVQWIPFFFLALDKLLRGARWPLVLLAIVMLVLQILASLMVAYILFLAAAIYVLLSFLWHRQLPKVKTCVQLAVVVVVTGALVLPIALPYYRAARELDFQRDQATVQALSATLYSFLSVPRANWIYGRLLARFAHNGNYADEHNLFPGLTAVALALVGTVTMRRRMHAIIFIAIVLVMALVSFGPRLYLSADQVISLPFPLPYEWLYEWLPGFSSLRVGARFDLMVSFGLAGLAALGLAWGLGRLSTRATVVAALAIGALVLMENLSTPIGVQAVVMGESVPQVYRWLADHDTSAPIAELPIGEGPASILQLAEYQYFSTYHWHPILTSAYFSYYPDDYKSLLGFVGDFPSRSTIDLLHEFDARYVIVHSAALKAADWNKMQEQLRAQNLAPRVSFGTDYVYEIAPGSEAFDKIQARVFVPSEAAAAQPLPVFLLLTNPTSQPFFFKPSHRLLATVNGQLTPFSLPFMLESGTTVISATLSIEADKVTVEPTSDSLLAFAPVAASVNFKPDTLTPRPVSLQLARSQIELRGNNSLHLTLQWRVLARVREPYVTEVALTDSGGREITHNIVEHQANPDPNIRWRPGEILTDELELTLPDNLPAQPHLVLRLKEPISGRLLLPLDNQAVPQSYLDLSAALPMP